jgi:hypothetical protein
VTFIYALIDPRTEAVRYVGKADDPQKRLHGHLLCRGVGHKQSWLKNLRAAGLAPVLGVLEECAQDVWQDRERHWIAAYREAGAPLTNRTAGGDGRLGDKATADSRALMSESRKAYLDTEDGRGYMSRHWRDYWASADAREKKRQSMLAYWASPAGEARRAHIAAANHAAWSDEDRSEARRANLSASGTASWTGRDERRQKQGDAMKSRWKDPEWRAAACARMSEGWAQRAAALKEDAS